MRYPVYVISKGRPSCCLTGRFLLKDEVPFKLCIEPQEEAAYRQHFPQDVLQVLPFSDLGEGSVPARNWVWEDAKALGHERHWILDDNIYCLKRRYMGRRIPINSEVALTAVEDFTDRYENIAITGLNYEMFVVNGVQIPPYVRNVHCYSCLLIRTDLPYKWRGRYNEDTDLCLQVLSGGWCTVLTNTFLCFKVRSMKMGGGNTKELYQGDGRLKMARSLERMWPGVVETKRRFKRPQHSIKNAWGNFTTPLKLKASSTLVDPSTYTMNLNQVRPIKAASLRELVNAGTPS